MVESVSNSSYNIPQSLLNKPSENQNIFSSDPIVDLSAMFNNTLASMPHQEIAPGVFANPSKGHIDLNV